MWEGYVKGNIDIIELSSPITNALLQKAAGEDFQSMVNTFQTVTDSTPANTPVIRKNNDGTWRKIHEKYQ